jgi:hypothetical protein
VVLVEWVALGQEAISTGTAQAKVVVTQAEALTGHGKITLPKGGK